MNQAGESRKIWSRRSYFGSRLQRNAVQLEVMDTSTKEAFTVRASRVFLCQGGLQVPRKISFAGENLYGGTLIEGTGGRIDQLDLRGKDVVIMGMGAFATENARTAMMSGARHVTMVTRSLNTSAYPFSAAVRVFTRVLSKNRLLWEQNNARDA